MENLRIHIISKSGETLYSGGIDNIPLRGDAVEKRGFDVYRQLCSTKLAAIEMLIRHEFLKAVESSTNGCCELRTDWKLLPSELRKTVKIGDNPAYFVLSQN